MKFSFIFTVSSVLILLSSLLLLPCSVPLLVQAATPLQIRPLSPIILLKNQTLVKEVLLVSPLKKFLKVKKEQKQQEQDFDTTFLNFKNWFQKNILQSKTNNVGENNKKELLFDVNNNKNKNKILKLIFAKQNAKGEEEEETATAKTKQKKTFTQQGITDYLIKLQKSKGGKEKSFDILSSSSTLANDNVVSLVFPENNSNNNNMKEQLKTYFTNLQKNVGKGNLFEDISSPSKNVLELIFVKNDENKKGEEEELLTSGSSSEMLNSLLENSHIDLIDLCQWRKYQPRRKNRNRKEKEEVKGKEQEKEEMMISESSLCELIRYLLEFSSQQEGRTFFDVEQQQNEFDLGLEQQEEEGEGENMFSQQNVNNNNNVDSVLSQQQSQHANLKDQRLSLILFLLEIQFGATSSKHSENSDNNRNVLSFFKPFVNMLFAGTNFVDDENANNNNNNKNNFSPLCTYDSKQLIQNQFPLSASMLVMRAESYSEFDFVKRFVLEQFFLRDKNQKQKLKNQQMSQFDSIFTFENFMMAKCIAVKFEKRCDVMLKMNSEDEKEKRLCFNPFLDAFSGEINVMREEEQNENVKKLKLVEKTKTKNEISSYRRQYSLVFDSDNNNNNNKEISVGQEVTLISSSSLDPSIDGGGDFSAFFTHPFFTKRKVIVGENQQNDDCALLEINVARNPFFHQHHHHHRHHLLSESWRPCSRQKMPAQGADKFLKQEGEEEQQEQMIDSPYCFPTIFSFCSPQKDAEEQILSESKSCKQNENNKNNNNNKSCWKNRKVFDERFGLTENWKDEEIMLSSLTYANQQNQQEQEQQEEKFLSSGVKIQSPHFLFQIIVRQLQRTEWALRKVSTGDAKQEQEAKEEKMFLVKQQKMLKELMTTAKMLVF